MIIPFLLTVNILLRTISFQREVSWDASHAAQPHKRHWWWHSIQDLFNKPARPAGKWQQMSPQISVWNFNKRCVRLTKTTWRKEQSKLSKRPV